MKKHLFFGGLIVLSAVLAGGRTAAAGPLGYVLGNGGTTLHAFDLNSPGSAQTIQLIFSGDSTSLDAIDFRPLTGQLYGYDDVRNAYFTVDVSTGATTLGSGPDVTPTNTDKLDVDFNPMIDRLRTVTELDENIVYNPLTGTASNSATMPLAYGSGDPNFGVNPQIVGNAYTNNVLGGYAASTVQYAIDANLGVLTTLANNAGTLTTIARITLDGAPLNFGVDAGFDILSMPGGQNTAYAVLNVDAVAGLYTIDLNTGEADLVGSLPDQFGTIRGLAIQPVPEPSSLALGGLGAAFVAVAARRRRRAG